MGFDLNVEGNFIQVSKARANAQILLVTDSRSQLHPGTVRRPHQSGHGRGRGRGNLEDLLASGQLEAAKSRCLGGKSKKEARTAERAQAGAMGWLGGWFAAASCS